MVNTIKCLALYFPLFLQAGICAAQTGKAKKVEVLHTDHFVANTKTRVQKFIGACAFKHEDALMYCDSAYYYQDNNMLNAFGNVRINQGDSITVTGNTLKYDGNTKQAQLFTDVTLIKNKATLSTQYLEYNLETKIGVYPDYGTIINDQDTLISLKGYYDANSNRAFFRQDILIKSPHAKIISDTLIYQTQTKVTDLYGPTIVKIQNDILYSEYGWYNTTSDQASFSKNAYYQSGSQLLKGDSLYYDRTLGFGKAIKNVYFIDTVQQIVMQGEYGQHNKITEETFVTEKAFITIKQEKDSIYLSADTLKTGMEPKQKEGNSLDSQSSSADTSRHRILLAFNHVRVFKSDLQMVSDSLVFTYRDSTMRCYIRPAIWTENAQITADQINIELKNKKIDKIHFFHSAFIASMEADSTKFNQISGKNMLGLFNDDKLTQLDVLGNGESIYYAKEDSRYTGMNRSLSSNMVLKFADNHLSSIRMDKSVDATLYPLNKIQAGITDRLDNFLWRAAERPISKEDIFRRYSPQRKP